MRPWRPEPPQFTSRTVVLAAAGAAVGTFLFALPARTMLSLAVGVVLGQWLFVLAVRRFSR